MLTCTVAYDLLHYNHRPPVFLAAAMAYKKWLTFAVIMVIVLILNLIHERVKLQFLEGLPLRFYFEVK